MWGPGGTVIEDSHVANGPYSNTLVMHTNVEQPVQFLSGAYFGPVNNAGMIEIADAVHNNPDLSIPAGVPRTAEEAASGLSGAAVISSSN